jgi:hypothetical protein
MPRAGTIVQRGGKNVDYYEISVRQFSRQILPAGLPPTTVWGYGPAMRPAPLSRTPGTRRRARPLPQSPGLGVAIDDRLLHRYGTRFHVSTPARVALRTVREKGVRAALALKKAKERAARE